MRRFGITAVMAAACLVGPVEPVSAAPRTPDQIAAKASAKIRAIAEKTTKQVQKLETRVAPPMRRLASLGGPIETRSEALERRAASLAVMTEKACVQIRRERERALGSLVRLEGKASAASITAARQAILLARDEALALVNSRAMLAADRLAAASALDPADGSELALLAVVGPGPSCATAPREDEGDAK